MLKKALFIILLCIIGFGVNAASARDAETQLLVSLQQADKAMHRGEYAQALRLNDDSLAFGQRLDVAQYRWQQYQQRAKILYALGDKVTALDYWQLAMQQLNRIQAGSNQQPMLEKQMQDSRLAYLYALLEQPDSQSVLRRVVDVWEGLKRRQIEEYLGQFCLIPEQKITTLLADQKDVAIVYPVVLNDRIDLLVEISGTIYRYKIKQNPKRISQLIKRMQQSIVQRRDNYRRYAKALYAALIQPMQDRLQQLGVSTLVWVQDQSLNDLVLAALQNVQGRFLVQDYAMVVSPAMSLLANNNRNPDADQILLAGMSQAAEYQSQWFPALNGVDQELHGLQKILNAQLIGGDDFSQDKLVRQLQNNDYDVIHLATHAQIGETIKDSFLLTSDGAIPLSDLQDIIAVRRYASYPLELLTLSACRTAAGVQSASLGLAGIVVQSGARSALASLWQVDDLASAKLMQGFYKQWGKVNKAKALQQAQLQLLSTDYQHPFYWSGFILLGHWD